jgi:hypothetical protein
MMHGMRMGPARASQVMFEKKRSKRPLMEHMPTPGKCAEASRKSDAIRRWFCIESLIWFCLTNFIEIELQLLLKYKRQQT